MIVVTKSGKSYNGLVKKDSADEIILATGPKEEAASRATKSKRCAPATCLSAPSLIWTSNYTPRLG